jgi:hypothetical protein
MPHLSYIQVYDNSTEAATGGTVPNPMLVLEMEMEMENGRVIHPVPGNLKALQKVPEWAKPILEAALSGAHMRE